MVVYMKIMLLVFRHHHGTDAVSRDLEMSVKHKDPRLFVHRYLGAFRCFDVFDPYKLKALLTLLT